MTAVKNMSVRSATDVSVWFACHRPTCRSMAWSLAVGDRLAYLFCLAAVCNRFADHCFARGRIHRNRFVDLLACG